MIDLTGSHSVFIHQPLPSDDPLHRKSDITLAQKMLNNWEPLVPIEEGLQRTIAYFDSLLSDKM